MIAAERVEQEPFFTDYVNYNEADKGIRDINRDLSLRDLQDIGNRGDIDELINHHLFKMNEGRLTAELGDFICFRRYVGMGKTGSRDDSRRCC